MCVNSRMLAQHCHQPQRQETETFPAWYFVTPELDRTRPGSPCERLKELERRAPCEVCENANDFCECPSGEHNGESGVVDKAL